MLQLIGVGLVWADLIHWIQGHRALVGWLGGLSLILFCRDPNRYTLSYHNYSQGLLCRTEKEPELLVAALANPSYFAAYCT